MCADRFYSILFATFNRIYAEQKITITSRNPPFVTPLLKIKLREKNRLMRHGQLKLAEALGQQIGKAIVAFNAGRLRNASMGVESRDVWDTVRDITNKKQHSISPLGVDCDSLNDHYFTSSTDPSYFPLLKSSSTHPLPWPSEEVVFHALIHLRSTAISPDLLPAWLLKLVAPNISSTASYLFRLSISSSIVPRQWLSSTIVPISKIAKPLTCSHYHPISLTPIFSRILEKLLVRRYIYPSLSSPSTSSIISLQDQFAFKPSGSTTAALTGLLKIISDNLEICPFVHLVAFNFSRAFDTVRHATLFGKVAQFPLPDLIYNWMVNFFLGRVHQARFNGLTSSSQSPFLVALYKALP